MFDSNESLIHCANDFNTTQFILEGRNRPDSNPSAKSSDSTMASANMIAKHRPVEIYINGKGGKDEDILDDRTAALLTVIVMFGGLIAIAGLVFGLLWRFIF